MDEVKLICGDAIEQLAQLDDQSVDLIIADPPYNLGKNYGNNHDLKGFDDYISFTKQWLTESKRVLKDTGTIYVFMGVRFISYLYDVLDRDLQFFFNSWICWHYTQGLGKRRGFSPRHDDILMFTKTEKYNFYLDPVRVPQKYYRARNNMRGANPGDVWLFSHVHYCNENRQKHPTQKPEGLIERMVLASSQDGDLVVDPFSGSGTTARVCQQLNRRCLGIEMNPDYIEGTKARLAQPFVGFDSVDERLYRIPNDLNDPEIRQTYLENHIQWFLRHHPESLEKFYADVHQKYNEVPVTKREQGDRLSLFDSM
ncbi:MAG: DNA methyltransferase [Chloroflexota bacterium]